MRLCRLEPFLPRLRAHREAELMQMAASACLLRIPEIEIKGGWHEALKLLVEKVGDINLRAGSCGQRVLLEELMTQRVASREA